MGEVSAVEQPAHLRDVVGEEALNRLNRRLMERINARKRVYLTGTLLSGRFAIRICVLSFRTHRERLEEGIEDIRAAAAETLEAP